MEPRKYASGRVFVFALLGMLVLIGVMSTIILSDPTRGSPSEGVSLVFGVIWIILLATMVISGFLFMGRLAKKTLTKENFVEVAAGTIAATKSVTQEIANRAQGAQGSVIRSQREEDAYAVAAKELEDGAMQKGLWAKAFADAEGNEAKQKALYLRYRSEQIIRN